MKTALVLALLLPPFAFAADAPAPRAPREDAQPHKDPPKQGEPLLDAKYVDRLDEQLQLKSEQRVKIKAAIDRAKPELEKLRKELEAVHEKMRQAMREVSENIRAALDMEQKERFDELSVRMRRRFHARMRPQPGGGFGGRFHEEGPGRGGAPEHGGGPPPHEEDEPGPDRE